MYTSAKRRTALISLLLTFLVVCVTSRAQTFRGAINGSVTDASGAVVVGAQVVATETATGVAHNTVSSSAGDFSFPDLPLGSYDVTVSATGFRTVKTQSVPVSAGAIYTVPVKLAVASGSEVVEVSASALSLDTTTSTQTSTVGEKAVSNLPLNGRDFTQLMALTPGFSGYAGGVTSGSGSLNGMRFEQVNWQIDGVDNNDLWANIPAVNQSGVNGIAGTLLPLDSVEQFSVQTQASAEAGRNPGGVINLALKAGTNAIHGTAYYFNRNEAFAEPSPFIAYGEAKQENRTYNVGGSLGGSIIKDKLFYFVTYEKQVFAIGEPGEAVEPSAAYQAEARAVMAQYGVPVGPVSANLLNILWPPYALTGPAGGENYNSPDPEFGDSNNGLIKLDYALNAKNNISAHWFGGQGNQTAPDGSELLYYYTIGPIHIYNYALQWNYTPTSHITNQVLAGVNYFNQIFIDDKTDFNLAGAGFVSGSNYAGVAPHLRISGFDPVGIVAPSGRNDITGHLDDTLSWTKGKHEFRFGGEFRQAQIDAFNTGNSSGLFNFTGAQGPWSALQSSISDTNILSLADFLAGYVDTSTLDVGDPKRQVFINTFSVFAQDAWKLTSRFTGNYGLRFDYEGPLHDSYKDLSVFRPNLGGLVFQGAGINSVYPQDWTNFSPRLGFAYQPFEHNDTTVLRGGIGLYFDQPVMSAFLNNKTSNTSPIGIQSNPAGPNPVFTISKSAYTVQSGQQIFPSSATASCTVTPTNVSPCGIFTVSPNFRTPYVINYNLNIQQSLGPKMLAQIGYIGNESRKLVSTIDINQAAFSSNGSPSTTAQAYAQQASRPYFSAFPTYGNINQLGTIATGNYNSLQAILKFANYHGLTAQASYTWGHAFDEMSQSRSLLPQDSYNFKGDYGNSGLDTRDNFTTFLSYAIPTFSQRMRRLSEGWVVNGLIALHTGQPFTVYNSDDTSGTDENAQRVNLIGNPYAGITHKFYPATATASATEQWVNPAAFASPANGALGTMPRNALYGPGYADADLSVFKTTRITERISLQLRGEVFNAFNNKNFAPPNNTIGGGFGELYSTIGNYWGAPGVGPGEPLNAQLGGKIIF
jgi:hypothetical protein